MSLSPPRAPISVDKLLAVLGADVRDVRGSRDRCFTRPAPLAEADTDALSFCSQRVADGLPRLRASRAGVVICAATLPLTADDVRERTLILVENPRLAFIRAMRGLFHERAPDGIHGTAVVDPSAVVTRPTSIGPYCHVAAGVEIGSNAYLLAHVVVHAGTTIGARVRLNAGAVIGTDGFGYERNDDGVLERFQQVGGVVIEDDVDIGAQVVVNRGTLGSTVIGRGSKINNLVNVGHNTVIGRDVFVAAGSVIAGSVRIGDGVWIAPRAVIREGVVVGKRATITMGAVVVKDVPDDATVAGMPARVVPRSGA